METSHQQADRKLASFGDTLEDYILKIHYVTALTKQSDKIDIIYSISFIEDPFHLLDNILNILIHNIDNQIRIVCSTLHKFSINLPNIIIFSPPSDHFLNYILIRDYDFKHFCIIRPDTLFIKRVINQTNLKSTRKETTLETILDKILKDHKKNSFRICSVFMKYGIVPLNVSLSCLFIPKAVFNDMMSFYGKDLEWNRKLVTDECLIYSYLGNYYEFPTYEKTGNMMEQILQESQYVSGFSSDVDDIKRSFVRMKSLTLLK